MPFFADTSHKSAHLGRMFRGQRAVQNKCTDAFCPQLQRQIGGSGIVRMSCRYDNLHPVKNWTQWTGKVKLYWIEVNAQTLEGAFWNKCRAWTASSAFQHGTWWKATRVKKQKNNNRGYQGREINRWAMKPRAFRRSALYYSDDSTGSIQSVYFRMRTRWGNNGISKKKFVQTTHPNNDNAEQL